MTGRHLMAITLTVFVTILSGCGGGGGGQSAPSNPAVSAASYTAPSVPQDFSAIGGDQTVTLFWNAPADNGGSSILSYEIYRITIIDESGFVDLSNKHFAFVGSTLADEYTFADETVTNGFTYAYTVVAVNRMGQSTMTEEVIITPATAPQAPKDFAVVRRDCDGVLSWGKPADDGGAPVTGYVVYRGLSPDTMTKIGELTWNLTEYVDCTGETQTAFYYSVAATNGYGEGQMAEARLLTLQ